MGINRWPFSLEIFLLFNYNLMNNNKLIINKTYYEDVQ